jgi:hypothetical protein
MARLKSPGSPYQSACTQSNLRDLILRIKLRLTSDILIMLINSTVEVTPDIHQTRQWQTENCFSLLLQVLDASTGSRSSNRLVSSSLCFIMGNNHVARLSDFVISKLSWYSFGSRCETISDDPQMSPSAVLVRALWLGPSDTNVTLRQFSVNSVPNAFCSFDSTIVS